MQGEPYAQMSTCARDFQRPLIIESDLQAPTFLQTLGTEYKCNWSRNLFKTDWNKLQKQ